MKWNRPAATILAALILICCPAATIAEQSADLPADIVENIESSESLGATDTTVPPVAEQESEITFEPAPYSYVYVGAYKDGGVTQSITFGGGKLYDGDQDVSDLASYKWNLLMPSGQIGEAFQFYPPNLLTIDDTHPYGAIQTESVTRQYQETLVYQGVTHTQKFTLDVIGDMPSFEILASGETASPSEPVVISANMPADYDARVKASLIDAGAQGELRRDTVHWLPEKTGVSETDANGNPRLTLKGAPSKTTANVRCVIEYTLTTSSGETRRVIAHSDQKSVTLEEAELPPLPGVDDPSSSDEDVVASDMFALPPMTEAQTRALYRQLILPYHDSARKGQPFGLKDAQTNEDGSLSTESKAQLFNFINFVRQCAGVRPLTGIDDQKSYYAQKGVEFLRDNDALGHFAAAGVPGAEDADKGLQNSNLSWAKLSDGSPCYLMELQTNQLYDAEPANWPGLGHRRWLLDNRSSTTGFGYAAPQGTHKATNLAVYIYEDSRNAWNVPGPYFEAYPGIGAFPVELVCKGWSLSLGSAVKASSSLQMTVTREEGESIALERRTSSGSLFTDTGDWFYVDTQEIGSGDMILFNPGTFLTGGTNGLVGHTYTITLTGLVSDMGSPMEDVSYSTRFISLANETQGSTPAPSTTPDVEETPSVGPVQTPAPVPTVAPTTYPTLWPTATPTYYPTWLPTYEPTYLPTYAPVASPSPSVIPSASPSPSMAPTPSPSASASPTQRPIPAPVPSPSMSVNDSFADVETETDSGTVLILKHDPSLAQMSAGELMEALSVENGSVSVHDENGKKAASTDILRTGMVLRIRDTSGTIVSETSVIVPGDVNGTGVITISQLVWMARDVSGKQELEDLYKIAGDHDGDGKISITDIVSESRLLRTSLNPESNAERGK